MGLTARLDGRWVTALSSQSVTVCISVGWSMAKKMKENELQQEERVAKRTRRDRLSGPVRPGWHLGPNPGAF